MQVIKLTIYFVLLPLSVFAQTVTTNVSGEGDVSYFYEEYRPPKFDLGSFTLCWGGDSDYENGNLKIDPNKGDANKGEMTIGKDVHAKGFVQHMMAQKLEWESIFNKEEYTFNIKFKKVNGRDRWVDRSSTCNTKNWKYKVESATASINTSVDIAVPANTWILRLKPTVNTHVPNLVYDISNASEVVGSNRSMDFEKPVKLIVGEYSYFFVKPSSLVKLSLNFKSDTKEYDILANFEVTFVGFNRCEQSMNDFKALINKNSSEPLSSDMVTQAFEKVGSSFYANTSKAVEDVHKAMAFLGCATSQAAAAPLHYDNKVGSMLQILYGIDSFKDKVVNASLSRNNVGANTDSNMTINVNALNVLANMARYALASTSINNLKPLCKTHQFMSLDSQSKYMTGYLFMRQQLDVIRFLIGLDNNRKKEFIDVELSFILDELLRRLEGVDTQEYMAKNRQEIANLYQLFYKLQSWRISVAFSRFNELPKIRANRDLVNLSQALADANKAHDTLHGRLFALFKLLARIDRNITDFTPFKKDLAELKEALNRVYIYFPKVYEMVDGDLASKFRDDVDFMDMDHRAPTEKWLTSSYGGFLLDFVKTYQHEKNYLTAEELKQCLFSPEL